MVASPAGTFLMGSSEAEQQTQIEIFQDRGWSQKQVSSIAHELAKEGPQHRVTVSAFQCMRFPVTRRLYAAVIGTDPMQRYYEYLRHSDGIGGRHDQYSPAPDARPVFKITWLEAIRFCNALSSRFGIGQCYEIHGDDKPADPARLSWNSTSDGFRLPTEAEWEYACRAGSTTRWAHGDDEAELNRYAWFADSPSYKDWFEQSTFSPAPVQVIGQKQANAWGLHDMQGNVREWCFDPARDYGAAEVVNPIGDSAISNGIVETSLSNQRVQRGGSINDVAGNVRPASRWHGYRVKWMSGGSFRCVRGVL